MQALSRIFSPLRLKHSLIWYFGQGFEL
jgi:hypothetical protein